MLLDGSELPAATTAAAAANEASSGAASSLDPAYALLRDQTRFWVQRVAVPMIMVVGLFGNLITVIIMTRRRMRSTTNMYLAALAFVDMLYLVLTFLLGLSHYPNVAQRRFYLYWKLKPFLMMLTDSCSNTSVWLTVTFTIERFIAVRYPIKGKVWCTEERAKRLIVCVFLFAILFTLPVPFEWNVVERRLAPQAGPTSRPLAPPLMLPSSAQIIELNGDGDGDGDDDDDVDETSDKAASFKPSKLRVDLPISAPVGMERDGVQVGAEEDLIRSQFTTQDHNHEQQQRDGAQIDDDEQFVMALEYSDFGSNETYKTIYYWSTAAIFYFIPLLSLTFFNGFLIHSVHQSRRERNKMTNQQTGSGATLQSNVPLPLGQQAQPALTKSRLQLAKSAACSLPGTQCGEQIASGMSSESHLPEIKFPVIGGPAQADGYKRSCSRFAFGTFHCASVNNQRNHCDKRDSDLLAGAECVTSSCKSAPAGSAATKALPKRAKAAAATKLATRSAPWIQEQQHQQRQQQQQQQQQWHCDQQNENQSQHQKLPASDGASNPITRLYLASADNKSTGEPNSATGSPVKLHIKEVEPADGQADGRAPANSGQPTMARNQLVSVDSSLTNNHSTCSSSFNEQPTPTPGQQQQHHHHYQQHQHANVMAPASSQERRITIMLISVVILFLVCQIPTAAMLLYTSVHETLPNTNEQALQLALGNIFNFLMAVNAAGNFILYSFLSKKYRRTFVILFCKCLRDRPTSKPSGPKSSSRTKSSCYSWSVNMNQQAGKNSPTTTNTSALTNNEEAAAQRWGSVRFAKVSSKTNSSLEAKHHLIGEKDDTSNNHFITSQRDVEKGCNLVGNGGSGAAAANRDDTLL